MQQYLHLPHAVPKPIPNIWRTAPTTFSLPCKRLPNKNIFSGLFSYFLFCFVEIRLDSRQICDKLIQWMNEWHTLGSWTSAHSHIDTHQLFNVHTQQCTQICTFICNSHFVSSSLVFTRSLSFWSFFLLLNVGKIVTASRFVERQMCEHVGKGISKF